MQEWIPALVTFFLVFFLLPLFIKFLLTKSLTQPIRQELPNNQQMKKGTPLMAGCIFLIGIIVSYLSFQSYFMLYLCITFFLFSFVGFMDDYRKASKQDPAGVSAKTKLLLQSTITVALLYGLSSIWGLNPSIYIHDSLTIYLPSSVYVLLIALFIIGSANAINFTDGMDGLLSFVAIPTYFFFYFISDHIEVRIFSLIMISSLIAFLIYNKYPAKAFMGDTGSLAIGGSLAFLAIIEKVEILIPILFFIYLAEQLSVILQVLYYRFTKRRIFKMTPIHYHYGIKYGWSENVIVTVFGFVSWICTVMSIAYWKIFL